MKKELTEMVRVFVFAFLADRVTKIFAVENLAIFLNSGIAFSMFRESSFVPLLGVVALTVFFAFSKHFIDVSGKWAALFLAGAAGNIVDRLLYGYVIDWIYVYIYINVADIWLCVGAAGMLARAFSKK